MGDGIARRGIPMQDIVLRLLEEAVQAECGEDTVNAVFETSGFERPSGCRDAGPQERIEELFDAAVPLMHGTRADVEKRIGRQAVQELRFEYPSFFMEHTSVQAFVASWETYVHPKMERLFPEARFPKLHVRGVRSDGLDIDYDSQRGLCRVAEGLLLGIGDLYEQDTRTEHTRCKRRGEQRCSIRLTTRPPSTDRETKDLRPVHP